MAGVLDSAPYAGINTPYKRGTILPVVATAGSGDGTFTIDTSLSAPGFTISGTAGAYTGTMPKTGKVVAWSQCLAATPASHIVNFITLSGSAGTFSFETHHGDATSTGETFADGDKIFLFFMMEGG